jgi:hypothetical protein
MLTNIAIGAILMCNAFIPARRPTDMIDMSKAHGGKYEIVGSGHDEED